MTQEQAQKAPTSSGHTPEPWERSNRRIYAIVADAGGGGSWDDDAHRDHLGGKSLICESARGDNLNRIVSCVNACAGLNPDAVPGLVEALEAAVAYLPDPSSAPNGVKVGAIEASKAARAALAAAKGGAA